MLATVAIHSIMYQTKYDEENGNVVDQSMQFNRLWRFDELANAYIAFAKLFLAINSMQ